MEELGAIHRGDPGRKICITGANGENKTELIHFLSVHYRSKNVYQSLKPSLVITDGECICLAPFVKTMEDEDGY